MLPYVSMSKLSFLENITSLSELGAQKPIFLWEKTFSELGKKILPILERAGEAMNKKTIAYAATANLVTLLKEQSPNEYILAKSIQEVAKAFTVDLSGKEFELAERLTAAANAFAERAQVAETFAKKRLDLKVTYSAEEIRTVDYNLFDSVGLIYCLEYYLAIYKAMVDQPTEAQQRWFIERPEVDLGAGSVPGIWKDMRDDEVLEKFILLILDDTVRESLIKAYYSAKIEVMKVDIHCENRDHCAATYKNTSVPQIMASIKQFNQELLRIFQTMGIQKLKSLGFTPYGFQPRLDKIKL